MISYFRLLFIKSLTTTTTTNLNLNSPFSKVTHSSNDKENTSIKSVEIEPPIADTRAPLSERSINSQEKKLEIKNEPQEVIHQSSVKR